MPVTPNYKLEYNDFTVGLWPSRSMSNSTVCKGYRMMLAYSL